MPASLFFSYTNMNKMNSLQYVKEHPQISNFLRCESRSSKSFKVRAISDLRDLYGNKIQGLSSLDSNFFNLHDWSLGKHTDIIQKTPSKLVLMYSFNVVLGSSWWVIG